MEQAILTEWTEGPGYYWPERAQKKDEPPIPCRLIRIRASRKAKRDVWLLTNVLDPKRLTTDTADRVYGSSGLSARRDRNDASPWMAIN
jgi:hypothetical protein